VFDLLVQEMTRTEFDEWRDSVVRAFADEQVAAGNWSAQDAIDLAIKDNDAWLPGGFTTPGMVFLSAYRADGTRVGVLWLGLTHPRGKSDCGFIYDIEIDEPHRQLPYSARKHPASMDR
jgi:hypothetical protein